MGSSNFIISLLGWTFIPDFATRHFLNFIYRSPIRIVAPPHPGSPQHRQHYTVAFGLVILSYLMYTLVQSSRAMPPNFYEILDVRPDVDENGLKLAFRTFAKRYHPDRVGPQGEELFMYVRDAFEALKDPVVRFAYDRFGPDAVTWSQHCRTTREFLKRGLMVSSGYHIVTGIALLFWSAIGKPSVVSFWRYVLFALLFAAELSFILSSFPATSTSIFQLPNSIPKFLSFSISIPSISRSTSFSIFQRIWPNRVPYQHILFLHQLFMFLSVALTRVVPQFISLLNEGEESRQLEPLELALWERIYGTIAIADREASVLLHTILQSINLSNTNKPYHNPTLAAMHPVSPHEAIETLDRLTPEMYAMVVEANIKSHESGPISSAWRAALAPKRNFTNQAAVSDDQGTPSTPVVKQEVLRTPNNILKKDLLDRAESIDRALENTSSPAASDSGNPRARRAPLETRSPTRRSSFGPSAGEC